MSAGRRLRLWPAGLAAGVVISAFLVVAAVIAALFGASATCLGTATGGVSGSAPTTKAAREIPEARLHIFVEAGRRFDISWPFLASIGVQECGADGHCGVAESGCAGVMEIAYVRGSACSPDASVPTLWERFRVDGDGDGQTSIFDPADAIFTAARIFRRSLGAPPTGGPYHGYYEAACGYYGACSDSSADYAPEVMARAVSFGFGHEGGDTADVAANDGPPAPAAGPSCGASVGGAGGGASGAAIVRIARSQIGTPEVQLGSNCTKYGPCEEWCALFVAWVWQHAGVEMAGGTVPYSYSGEIGGWAGAHGGRLLAPGATPSPGDAVLFGRGPDDSAHVAIVEAVFGGEITTIDGNYDDRVSRVGPFLPALAVADGEPARIYAYAEPPGLGGEGAAS
jgi:cell wall-associated NlpC family hydrolase